MSGAELIAVAGVISSIIAIVDGLKQVVDATSEVEGLPKAFRQASSKLPLVNEILEATKHNFGEHDVSSVERSVALVVDDCKDKWETLKALFDKVIPEEKASRMERYYLAVKSLGKGAKVENLMKEILEDIQLLATIKTMTTTNREKVIETVTATQKEKIAKAITDVAAWPPSVPDDVFQEGTYTNINYGTGQYIAQGDAEQNNFQGEARQYHSGGGPQTINEAQTIINDILNIHLLQSPKQYEAQACLTALFLTNPRDDREKLVYTKGSRADGTCEWIKTNALYKSWLRTSSQLLWLSGGPGKGKTMLSIFLAEELERAAELSQNTLFLQYFCDNKDDKRNTAVTLIRGLIFQLLQLRPNLFKHILPSFEIHRESLFSSSTFETLWRIFETMIRDPVLATTYCVLDGLDECDEASLEVLLNKFKTLFSTKYGKSSACYLNLIVVSRDLPDFIPEALSSFPHIRLESDADTEVNDDIHRFIEAKVNELSVYRQYPEALRIYVETVFRDRAKGTFLWVGIVAQELRKFKATQVESALDLFPAGLEELYARMLLQIKDDLQETAARILRWVVLAIRPMTLPELSAAIEPAVKSHTILSSDEVIRDQVLYCGYFLTIKNDEVSLIHQSAKDYLLRETPYSNPKLEVFRVQKKVGNLEIAGKCFYYLQNGALAAGEVNLKINTTHLKAFPLLSYAALHWPEHARTLARSENIFDLSLPFYYENSYVRESWLKTYWGVEESSLPPNSFTLLHLASYFGIVPLAENLLLKNVLIEKVERLLYLNKKDDRGRTALVWATQRQHNVVVQLLLEMGADAVAKDSEGHTALHFAALHGNEDVVWLLLKRGADVEAKNAKGHTALYFAAMRGDEAVTHLLLEIGANIKVKDSEGWTVLHFAALRGNEPVVRLLLEMGADIEAKNVRGGTALYCAALQKDEAMMRLLLQLGADIEAKDSRGLTALYCAALKKDEAMIRLLLEMGADIEAKDSRGGTALYCAALEKDEAMMRLLLELGADIEAKDSRGGTALYYAALEKDEAMIRLLLGLGVDIEAKNVMGGTALYCAALQKDEAMIRLLLQLGADIEAKDSRGLTALYCAALEKDEAMMRLLLGLGADIEAKESNG